MDRRTFVAGMSLLPALQLTGCATRSSINDGVNIKPGEGLLAFKITSAVYAKMNYVKYEPSRTVSGFLGEMLVAPPGTFVVEKGETYFVHPVEAGEYMWGQLTIGMGAVANLHGSNRFVVNQGAITYIGHLSLSLFDRRTSMFSTDRGVTFVSTNKEHDMLSYLRINFPKYMATMVFRKEIAEIRLAS